MLALGAAVTAFVVAMMLVGAIAQFPITVADTAVGWLFGGHGADNGRPAVPDVCAAPPPVLESQPPPVTPVADQPGTEPSTPDPSPRPPAPAPGGDGQGRPTPQAMAVLKQIPVGTDVSVAQGWILYRLAHPQDDGTFDFAAFAAIYRDVAGKLSERATPLDVVATIDPAANYAPYLLLSQSGGYLLMRQGSVTGTDHTRDELIDALGATCAGQGPAVNPAA